VEVENESLSQQRMRGLWPHRVLGSDPLPLVQVGLEERASCKRDGASAQA